MKASERRQQILQRIEGSASPVSATALSEAFGVSRQVIVQDIALLRSEHDILATNRGYILNRPQRKKREFKVCHTDEQIEDELSSIVALGGIVENVFVYHRVYGKIEGGLYVENQMQVADYVRSLSGASSPLKNVTEGYHYHLVSADSEETLDRIAAMLQEKGYLVL